MKILFWLLIAADTAVLLLFFLLGLAAAGSTKDSPAAVAFSPPFLVPALVLIAAVLLFTRVSSSLGRSAGLLLAAAPALLLVYFKATSTLELKQNMNSDGEIAHFRAGPLREIADAIKSNDSATVARLIPTVDVNQTGFQGVTFLMLAIRQLETAPTQLGVLRALLAAGANPNLAAGGELPLDVAIQQGEKAGAEPVLMLLKAGANPNAKDQWGSPTFFMGTGVTVPTEVLKTLLDNGADVKLTNKDGHTVVLDAAQTGNWKAVLMLLERGVDYKASGRTLSGESFTQLVESQKDRTYGDTATLAKVVEWLKRQ